MNFLLHIFVLACLRLFACMGYNLVFGKMKILYFAHVGVALLLSYLLWVPVMQYGVHIAISLLVSLIALLICAYLLAVLSVRLTEDAFGVMSIALHLIVLSVVLNWQSVTRGALGIPRIPRLFLPESLLLFALCIGCVAFCWCLFVWWIDRGVIGRQVAALSEHEWYAESLGIKKTQLHFIVFLVSGLGMYLFSVFYPPFVYLLSPSDYHFNAMVLYIMIVVAGGPGRFWGVILSTFSLTLLGEGIRFVSLPPNLIGPVRLILFGIILFVAVWYRRDTLFPKARTV